MSFKTYVVRLCGPLVCESLKVTLQSDKQIFQSTVTQENGIQLYYASFTHWDVKKSLIILLYALDLPRKAFVQSRFCAMDPSLHEPVACRCWYPKYIYHSYIDPDLLYFLPMLQKCSQTQKYWKLQSKEKVISLRVYALYSAVCYVSTTAVTLTCSFHSNLKHLDKVFHVSYFLFITKDSSYWPGACESGGPLEAFSVILRFFFLRLFLLTIIFSISCAGFMYSNGDQAVFEVSGEAPCNVPTSRWRGGRYLGSRFSPGVSSVTKKVVFLHDLLSKSTASR